MDRCTCSKHHLRLRSFRWQTRVSMYTGSTIQVPRTGTPSVWMMSKSAMPIHMFTAERTQICFSLGTALDMRALMAERKLITSDLQTEIASLAMNVVHQLVPAMWEKSAVTMVLVQRIRL